ncbi:MAG TPA: TonB family protein [Tenuifilaceae bacterium]|nr:TonB family protein [Tenuifilaceae bacterium]HPJ44485.1 TonB family protein [Tenuifilaceae bacterium]HPQ33023.1 TonB family protein [Tenuifilaceae bacterium]HRX67954.1 TonB family protein [Tenuifilaceae bacterium]
MTSKSKGIIGSLAVHTVLVVLLLVFGFRTPLPLPDEEGILINFGTSDQGTGSFEPKPTPPPSQQPESEPKTEEVEEENLTQDIEEAPSIPEEKPKPKPKPKKEEEKPKEVKPEEVNKPVEQVKPEEEKPREVNQQALFPGQKPGGSTTGEGETGQPGNQGDPQGSTESTSHTGSTTGGGGDGVGFSLDGRNALKLPPPEYPKQKSGKVVVSVTVDSKGNVTSVRGGVKGSTTNDIELVKAAEEAAKLAKFNVKPDAPAQNGTITYIFKLQQ